MVRPSCQITCAHSSERYGTLTLYRHSKETTWLDTSILAENARGPQHILNLAAEKIKDIQKKLDLPRHLESLQQQKQKAIIMIQSLSKELQSLDGKLPRILQRTTTSQSTASERRRRTATALTTGGVHGVLHFSDLFYEGMTDAAEKVSAANRLLWLPFRSDALDTIKQMEEMRNRLLFVQLAMLDMRMVDNELRAATHERLLLEIWKLLMGLNEAQTGEAEASDFSVRTGQNGNGLANDTCES